MQSEYGLREIVFFTALVAVMCVIAALVMLAR
jgi:hypothetical protein